MKIKKVSLEPFGLLIEADQANCDVRELAIEELRELFNNEHLLVLRGFRSFNEAEDFSSYCEKWGEISLWPFGKVLELIEQENPEDHIFDNNYVPLHWDGMYRPQVPEYQIFHCVSAPLVGQGGRTTFSNTALALQNSEDIHRSLWSKVTGTYKRKMEFYNSTVTSAVVTTHPRKGFPVIRYNEPPNEAKGLFLNPPTQKFTGITTDELAQFHSTLREALHAEGNFYAHEWHAGDLVIADNFTLLHGREEFISRAPRHLRRVHVLSDPPFNNPGLESYQ